MLFDHTKMHELAHLDLSAANIPWFGQLMGAPQIFAYVIQVNTWLKHYHVRIC
jgi:asparagine synthase (glutamine-hydrolysing)